MHAIMKIGIATLWLLSLLNIGLIVHLYNLSVQINDLQEANVHLQRTNTHLQKQNQFLRDECSTWGKVLYCGTTAYGISATVAGGVIGVSVPSSSYLYQAYNIISGLLPESSSSKKIDFDEPKRAKA